MCHVRVLLVNKFFVARGGAETVVLQTRRLLEEAGHEVVLFGMRTGAETDEPWLSFFVSERRYFDGPLLRRVRDAASTVYSFEARRRLRDLLRSAQPEVAHLHNVYHQLTLSLLDELEAQRIPTVMTLHDYKPACPAYQLLTHDGVCERCLGGAYWNAVRHRCLKGSLVGSALVALEAYLARVRRLYAKVDRFLAPSVFLRDVMVRAGMPRKAIEVLPNAVPLAPAPRPQPAPASFLYAGRLSWEKGIDTLLEAVALARGPLEVRIAGEGPAAADVRRRVEAEALPVQLLGFLEREDVAGELVRATASLLPSRCYENCPMAILEAGARGVPTIASRIGGIPELVTSGVDGMLVPPGDAPALASALDELAHDRERAAALGQAAYARVRARHSEDGYREALLAHYEAAVALRRRGGW